MAATTTIKQINLRQGQRAERKLLVTVAEWTENTLDGTTEGTEQVRELLGARTEDSSIEYNPDMQESTDILGNNYTDVNKTQPVQSFDPYLMLGGSRLGAYMNDIRRRNALSELTGTFTIYVITAFIGTEGAYECERHDDCTITYESIGGDANVNFPLTIHFSNKITTGTVDKIAPDFIFTADANV
jgi:hypothetical protein